MKNENRIFIKPARDGLVVRRFDRRHFPKLKAEGEWVVDCPQWRRYLKAGDVVLASPENSKTEKPKKSKGEDK